MARDKVKRFYDNAKEFLSEEEFRKLSLMLAGAVIDENTAAEQQGKLQDPFEDFAVKAFEKRYKQGDTVRGLSTGYWTLDRMTTGFKPGEIVVITAPSGLGKSGLCMNMIARQVISGHKCVLVTLENGEESFKWRMRSIMGQEYFEMMSEEHLVRLQTFFDITPKSVDYIIKNSKEWGAEVVYIDHINMFQAGMKNPAEELGAVIYRWRQLAIEYDLPIVVVAQMRKIPKGERPGVEDIRSSDFIRQAADTILVGDKDPESFIDHLRVTLGKRRELPLWREGSEVILQRIGAGLEEPCYTEEEDVKNDILGKPRARGSAPLTFR